MTISTCTCKCQLPSVSFVVLDHTSSTFRSIFSAKYSANMAKSLWPKVEEHPLGRCLHCMSEVHGPWVTSAARSASALGHLDSATAAASMYSANHAETATGLTPMKATFRAVRQLLHHHAPMLLNLVREVSRAMICVQLTNGIHGGEQAARDAAAEMQAALYASKQA
jgi:hypothetical protein